MLQDNRKSTYMTLGVCIKTAMLKLSQPSLPMQAALLQGSVLQVHAKQMPEPPGGTNPGIYRRGEAESLK